MLIYLSQAPPPRRPPPPPTATTTPRSPARTKAPARRSAVRTRRLSPASARAATLAPRAPLRPLIAVAATPCMPVRTEGRVRRMRQRAPLGACASADGWAPRAVRWMRVSG